MNAPVDPTFLDAARLARHVHSACERVAPTWPLDRFIAVNPYWGWRAQPIESAAARLGVTAGSRLTMPRSWYVQRWQSGFIRRHHLERALRDTQTALTFAQLEQRLLRPQRESPGPRRLPLVTDLRDAIARPIHMPGWGELVTQQLSQHCASHFDEGAQARWRPAREASLFKSWRAALAEDRGIGWRHGPAWPREQLSTWVDDPLTAIDAGLRALRMPPEGTEAYLGALLASINGWAAWCAYRRWQARLVGQDDGALVELLAARLCWERLLAEEVPVALADGRWAAAWGQADQHARDLERAQQLDWVLQRAAELAYREPLADGLAQSLRRPGPVESGECWVQAVFCIDVRSEAFRRALEGADPGAETRGFAGFFGLPIAYRPVGSALVRPQLPGLLAPTLEVSEAAADIASEASLAQALSRRRRLALDWRHRWAEVRQTASSAFGYVEACGIASGVSLVAACRPSDASLSRWEDFGVRPGVQQMRPRLASKDDDLAGVARLARNILHAMGLERHFAPIVLLVGHGSQSANNPHAASLDCGACGGQTGEVNARVLADLLNDLDVRDELARQGVAIPATTHFMPALHNTTTEEVFLHDDEALQRSSPDLHARLVRALSRAGDAARRERSASLGMQSLPADPAELARRFRQRANDASQVRPEWGLAGNAAFVVAPRARTRGLDLKGRVFLHDYDHHLDPDGSILTLIMTAPMVVTNWINLQYHASTVDNRRYGSGNKVLHNVVDGHLGVFEGNGGDLRIGLALQSLHDGQDWRHEPLRLSVFIEAPAPAIDRVIAEHEVVRHLVENRWIHLARLDAEAARIEDWTPSGWRALTST